MNIIEYLSSKQLTISCAESFTGGSFASYLTKFPGASECFNGGIVCYSKESKINLLKVSEETIDKYTMVSKETCQEMLDNCQKLFNSDISVAFTGNAGPDPSEGKEVGLVYIGFKYQNKNIVNELHLQGSREEIKEQAIKIIEQLIFTLI